jgi:two-component system, NtrC family, nitrogen regulation sensor histidine kinase NtrY
MKLGGRFTWKMLGAMLLVAVVAAGAAIYGLRFTLDRMVSSIGERHRATGASARAIGVFRAHFAERKDQFRRRADAVAANPPARLADLAHVDGLLKARMLEGKKVVDEWAASRDIADKYKADQPIQIDLAPVAGSGKRLLELTFGISAEVYSQLQELQRDLSREKEVDRAFEGMVPSALRGYLFGIAVVVVLTPIVVGLLLARRITARVARLHEAAQRVGAGDLTVQVAPTGKDELDEFGRAFDRMVAELSDARSRLEYLQKVSAWQEVARRLAHEIKNPLTPIQLSMQELATKYQGDDPAYRKLLDTAREILHEEITGLRRLVDDFSAFAKLPSVEPAPVDLAALVGETVRLHPEWSPHVRFEHDGTRVEALCDKILFRRVIANLVENALQAAQGAGRANPEVRLTVEVAPDRSRAAVVVDDNGPGVPEANRRKIFDPYVTHRAGGTGLGLAIVRKIVIDHGGDVVAREAPAPLNGARFVVEIPARVS